MADVTLHTAEPDQKPVLENLFQLYTHDFSDFWAGREDGELEEDGRFADYLHLDSYWTEPERTPLLIRVEGYLAGFALINTLFALRLAGGLTRWRSSSSPASTAASAWAWPRRVKIIGHRPGQWEMAVARAQHRRPAVLASSVAAEVAGRQVEEIDRDNDLWNGPIVRCRV